MKYTEGCQIPNLQKFSEGEIGVDNQPFIRKVKRQLAVPWNYYVKRWLKKGYQVYTHQFALLKTKFHRSEPAAAANTSIKPHEKLKAGDWVQVRSWEEIQSMLDPFHETRGCAFLEDMRQYCGTQQRVLKSMERFLDERDYKVKKVSGIILLENVICSGTPAFGKCDRCCFLFWREEWLEKIAT